MGATRFSEVGQKRVMMLLLQSAIATQIPGVIDNLAEVLRIKPNFKKSRCSRF
ncbi:MAG: hypothetical protein KME32_35145 [Mojavia pulchra JT2-VF2]|uniref:Uncharacterized protein n=1 Tax=Mojavia pulchra JT2-VF2 TaxID=287848 RepID=A0A951Q7S5_9NOST|nr:hypothetical protein [Mojavia pulchra JT2-VF2]